LHSSKVQQRDGPHTSSDGLRAEEARWPGRLRLVPGIGLEAADQAERFFASL